MKWNWKTPSLTQRLFIGLLIIIAASAFRAMFFSGLGRGIPYLVFYPATMLAALYGGLAAGFLATALSSLLTFFWVQQGELSPPEWLGFLVFVVSCVAISIVCEVLRRTRTKVENVDRNLQRETAEREHAMEVLTDSELRFRRLFETAQDGILILDAETGMVEEVNQYLIDLLGYSHETFLNKKVWELGFFKDIVANETHFAELQANKYIRYEDKALEDCNGQRHEVEFVSNVYLVNHHKVIQCNIRDISARKQAETYREMNREVLHLLYESGDVQTTIQNVITAVRKGSRCDAVGLRMQDGEDYPYFAQQGFSRDFLLTENTLLARGADGGVCRDKDGKVSLECTCGLVISGKTDASSPLFTKGGSFWTNDSFPLLELPSEMDPRHHPRNQCIHQGYASVALVPIRNQERIVGLLHLNDRRKGHFSIEIIELLEEIAAHIGTTLMRKQADTALLESEYQYRQLFEANSDGIAMVDSDTQVFTRVNAAFCQMLGYTAQELVALHVADIHPKDDLPTIMAGFETASRKTLQNAMPVRLLRKDGKTIHAEVNATPVRLTGRHYNLAIFRDITERKQAESEHEKLQAQFTQAQKMETVGRLAGGVAHDFNNLLMGIMGYTELCRQHIAPDNPIREYLDEIMQGAERSAEITRQLLAFARKQTIVPVVLDLNDAVDGMLKLLRRLIGEDIQLTWQPGSGLQPVKLDPSQVDQILANLCVNSRDAIAGVGKISLETGNSTIDAAYCATHPEAIPGAYVFLAVSDNGSGMDNETLAQIFEPFFTTKGLGKGTGLGLATVYGIVKQNNGFIYAYSEPGKGTTFKIYLPAIAEETMTTTVTRKADAPKGHGETVLLVKDEKSLRVTCDLFLKALNYKVLTAETPGEALKMMDKHPGDVHVLLTDVVMPGMDGRQLAERIGKIKSGVKVLFMSGYTADIIADRGVLDEGMRFLSKPFTRDDLARKVREILDSAPSQTT